MWRQIDSKYGNRREDERRQREKGRCEGENDRGMGVYGEPHGVLKYCHPAAES